MDEKEVVNGQSDLNGEIAALHSEDELLLEILTEAKALHEEASIQAKEQKAIKKDDGSEIFSNKNKEPRLININPLDLDGGSAQNAERENAKKLLKQLEAQRMAKTIEFSEPVQPAEEAEQPQEVTAQPKKTTALISEDSIEISLQVGAKMNQTDDDETPSITTANIKTVGTVEEEKISPYEKHFGTDTFDSLRVLKDYEDDVSNYEKLFGTPKPTNIEAQAVINRVPNYRAEIKLDKINLSAGKFSEILESEYLEYVGSNDPMITQSAEPAAPASTAKGEQKPEKKSFTAALTGLFANKNRESTSTQRADIVEDFNTPKDAKKIFAELTQNHRKLKLRSVVLAFCAVLSFALVIVRSVLTSGGTTETQGLSFVFALLNIFILTAAIIISHVVIANGLVPLIRFKGNSDTAPAAAAAASFLQAVAALFGADAFFSGALGIFTPIVITGLFLNALGKIFILRRVRANFKFVAEKGKKFAVKIFANDQKTAQKLVAGSAAEKPLIAYQHKTAHLNNFLKISYAPDLSEEMAGKIAPITVACCLLAAIIYGIFYHDVFGIFTFFALITAVTVPISNLISTNLPMEQLSKKLLEKQSMLSGYPAVRQFADTSAVMVNAKDIYPKEFVTLDGVKTFVKYKIDDKILVAAAVLKESDSPLDSLFQDFLSDNKHKLPKIEDVMYEDRMGLVAWVQGERVLLGSRNLLQKYGIEPPAQSMEEKFKAGGKTVTYFAHSGVLLAMFVTTLKPSPKVQNELLFAQENGISLLVSSNDYNITSEKIGDDFGLFYRTIKVLSPGLSTACDEATSHKEQSSRAYLATTGKFLSMLHSVTSCVRINSMFAVSVVIQLLGVIIGFGLAAVISFFAGVQAVGAVAFIIYSLFWAAVSVIVPLISKH